MVVESSRCLGDVRGAEGVERDPMKLSLLAYVLTLAVASADAEPDLGSAVLAWDGAPSRNVYFAFQGL
jgi:hypothetical protein